MRRELLGYDDEDSLREYRTMSEGREGERCVDVCRRPREKVFFGFIFFFLPPSQGEESRKKDPLMRKKK